MAYGGALLVHSFLTPLNRGFTVFATFMPPPAGEPVIPSLSLWERWRVYEPERAKPSTVPVGGGATTPRKSLSVSLCSTAPPVGEPVIPSLSLWERWRVYEPERAKPSTKPVWADVPEIPLKSPCKRIKKK